MTEKGTPSNDDANSPGFPIVADETMYLGAEPCLRQTRASRRMTWWKWEPKIPR